MSRRTVVANRLMVVARVKTASARAPVAAMGKSPLDLSAISVSAAVNCGHKLRRE